MTTKPEDRDDDNTKEQDKDGKPFPKESEEREA